MTRTSPASSGLQMSCTVKIEVWGIHFMGVPHAGLILPPKGVVQGVHTFYRVAQKNKNTHKDIMKMHDEEDVYSKSKRFITVTACLIDLGIV